MITIKNIEDMQPYYNEEVNTYIFEDDVTFDFDVSVEAHIKAGDIEAKDIKAGDIKAWDIKARDIEAWDIDAWDIDAWDIEAGNIEARNIEACNIDARNIDYYAVCFAYGNIVCKDIKGRRENSRHFCLDGEITIKGDNEK